MTATFQTTQNGDIDDLRSTLNRIADNLQGLAKTATEAVSHKAPEPVNDGEIARKIYKNRRTRETIFGGGTLFGEPSWDILLDLFATTRSGAANSISSTCAAASVPPTTALRHLSALEAAGIVKRQPDAFDRRRSYIRLTEMGLELMESYFRKCEAG